MEPGSRSCNALVVCMSHCNCSTLFTGFTLCDELSFDIDVPTRHTGIITAWQALSRPGADARQMKISIHWKKKKMDGLTVCTTCGMAMTVQVSVRRPSEMGAFQMTAAPGNSCACRGRLKLYFYNSKEFPTFQPEGPFAPCS